MTTKKTETESRWGEPKPAPTPDAARRPTGPAPKPKEPKEPEEIVVGTDYSTGKPVMGPAPPTPPEPDAEPEPKGPRVVGTDARTGKLVYEE